MMGEDRHNRREGYHEAYAAARAGRDEKERDILLRIIEANPHPDRNPKGLGRPVTHSKMKMDFLCLYMLRHNATYDRAVDEAHKMTHVWDEPVPQAPWAARHMQTIDRGWMQSILRKTAVACLKARGGAGAPVAIDSSGVEQDRYKYAECADPDHDCCRYKVHSKWHIVAIVGHQIILTAAHTSNSVSDVEMLIPLLEEALAAGIDLSGIIFVADKGYDSEAVFKWLYEHGMQPVIKQRENAVSSDKPNRRRAAEEFDPEEYKLRAMIEGIFGAEETRNHQLHCRFRREDNCERFGLGRAIGSNIGVANRLQCAAARGIPLPDYGKSAPLGA